MEVEKYQMANSLRRTDQSFFDRLHRQSTESFAAKHAIEGDPATGDPE